MIAQESAEFATSLHRKYASTDAAFDLVYTHCQIVAEIALDAVERNDIDIDTNQVFLAGMLHDIAAYAFYVPALNDFNLNGYQQHALFGAAILEEEDVGSAVVSAVKTHVLIGLTAKEIMDRNLKMPYQDFTPESELGELLCFADRYHSKTPQFNEPEHWMERTAVNFPLQVEKFKVLRERYGDPDLTLLSEKYGHKII